MTKLLQFATEKSEFWTTWEILNEDSVLTTQQGSFMMPIEHDTGIELRTSYLRLMHNMLVYSGDIADAYFRGYSDVKWNNMDIVNIEWQGSTYYGI